MSGEASLENLRQFMAIATNTFDRMQATTPQIEAHGDALDDLENEVDAKLSDFDSEADGLLKDLEKGETDALQDVSNLARLAQDAADDGLADAKGDLEQAGNRIEQALEAGGQELTTDHQELESEGFSPLLSALDEVQRAFDNTRVQNEAAFNAVENALKGFEADAEAAYADTGKELDAAASEGEQAATTLTTETTALVEAMTAAGGEFSGGLGQVEADAETAYGGLTDTVGIEAEALTTGVFQALETEAKHLATDLTDSVEQTSGMVATESAVPHLAELGSLHEAVWRAESAGADLDPLVLDLQRCQSVVELIDKLLASMQ